MPKVKISVGICLFIRQMILVIYDSVKVLKLIADIRCDLIIIIIIISLFQEDNIFGTNASLTYGPQLQR